MLGKINRWFSKNFAIRKPVSWHTKMMFSLFAIQLLLFYYNNMSVEQHVKNPKDTTLPSFTQIVQGAKTITHLDSTGKMWLWEDAKATLLRHFCGLTLGVAISVVLGIAMGCFEIVEAFFGPVLSLFSKIPPTAMMVVYFVLFGTDFTMFIAMVALGTIPILSLTICQFVQKDVSINLIDKAYTQGGSKAEVIYDIVFKSILPRIIEAVRLQAGPALVLLIAAEMLAADVGFGYRLKIQGRLLQMNVVFIYLAILAVSYHIIDLSLRFLRRRLCEWYGD
jgi:NitT/TauT family transport system permease protein